MCVHVELTLKISLISSLSVHNPHMSVLFISKEGTHSHISVDRHPSVQVHFPFVRVWLGPVFSGCDWHISFLAQGLARELPG